MLMPSRGDRKSIQSLHLSGEDMSLSADQRDALNDNTVYKARKAWTQPATAIPVPSNDNTVTFNSVQHRRSLNPYSSRTHNNLYETKAGNRSRQTIITNQGAPSTKRRRGTDNTAGATSSSKKTKLLASSPAVIDVDEVEDVEEPIAGPSSDTLDIISESTQFSSTKQRHSLPNMKSIANSFGIDHGNSRPSARKSGPEGGYSVRLHKQQANAPVHSPPTSPIEQFSEPLKAGDTGFVRKQADRFNRGLGDVPYIDLSKATKHNAAGNVKSGMKAKGSKAANKPSQADPIATSSTTFRHSSLQSNKSKTYSLPVAQWYLGHKLFPEPYTEPYSLQFQLCSDKFCLESEGHLETIAFARDVHALKLTTPRDVETNACIQVITKPVPHTSRHPGIGAEYRAYFVPGEAQGKGTVTIKLDLNHSDWSKDIYTEFSKLCSSLTQVQFLRDKASGSVWEEAQGVHVFATQTEGPDVVQEDSLNIMPGDLPMDDDTAHFTEHLLQDCDHDPPKSKPTVVKYDSQKPRSASITKAIGADEVAQPLRRSTRHQEPQIKRSVPLEDPDEVILSYPPATTGAVNITKADYNRLQPGEYLNDTLIEFALKLWHRELQETEPELAKQIHVFNSFFYKKLNKKNLEEGYQSVRRWTSKFDLFEKKFIIVPINENLHWYLAIIYLPENVLLPPPDKETRITRNNARASNSLELKPLDDANESASASVPTPDAESLSVVAEAGSVPSRSRSVSATTDHTSHSPSVDLDEDERDPTLTSEADVRETEDALMDFEISCHIEEHPRNLSKERQRSSSLSSIPDDINMDVDINTNEVADVSGEHSRAPFSLSHDNPSNQLEIEGALSEMGTARGSMDIDSKSVEGVSEAISPESFYAQPKSSKGKQKAVESTPDDDNRAVKETSASNLGHPRTYIFTLDSLGTRHSKAISTLGQYLKMEAKDKKGNENTSKWEGKSSAVPVQPNYWDCGIYLLHFARTFVKKPEYFCGIATQKSARSLQDRQKDWDAEHIEGFREELRGKITELSERWKKDRAAKDQEKKTEKVDTGMEKEREKDGQPEAETVPDSSDDEVDIVETTPAAIPVRGRARARGKDYGGKAKVTRLRG